MVFLVRAVFWLVVVFMLLPAGMRPRLSTALAQAEAAQAGTAGTALTPAMLADKAHAFCVSHGDTCRAGAAAAVELGARFGRATLAALPAAGETGTDQNGAMPREARAQLVHRSAVALR